MNRSEREWNKMHFKRRLKTVKMNNMKKAHRFSNNIQVALQFIDRAAFSWVWSQSGHTECGTTRTSPYCEYFV